MFPSRRQRSGAASTLPSKMVLALNALLAQSALASPYHRADSCRCFPGDACWPSTATWSAFNSTLGGKLIKTVPLASACHDPSFNNATCSALQDGWLNPETHYPSAHSIMAPFFANQSCDPFTGESAQCVVGTYVQYSVNVSTATDVSCAIRFSKEKNIRLVIRNTGHDYNGKSTGAGALAVWTHNLKSMSVLNWNDSHYSGKAIKMGAGVQGFEVMQFASANGLAVVGGECDTVGIAGGYIQGGGHSALSSKYGLAADQTLEFEVVDGNGVYHVANRQQNSDLYWALSGGGGGTYGVVLSVTVKAHTDIPVTGASLIFTSDGISQDNYYSAIETFHASLPTIVDAGVMSVWYFTNLSFAISPLTGPGVSVDEMNGLLKPLTDKLDGLNISYTKNVVNYPGYLQFFRGMFAPIQVGIAQYGGWLVPRSVVENNNKALTDAYRANNYDGAQFIGVGVNVNSSVTGDVYNAINPGWRNTLIDTVLTLPWSFEPSAWPQMVADQAVMTDTLLPRVQAFAPDNGAYLNEADWKDPNFKKSFYGSNYDKLLAIKNKYDPDHIFYAVTAVGSDYWVEQADKRLCKA